MSVANSNRRKPLPPNRRRRLTRERSELYCRRHLLFTTFAPTPSYLHGHCIILTEPQGGVGKTTSAINIGAGLVELGKRVLLVDLDPQANLTLSLGIPRQAVTIYESMMGESDLSPL